MKHKTTTIQFMLMVVPVLLLTLLGTVDAQEPTYGDGEDGPEVHVPPAVTMEALGLVVNNGDFELGNLSGWGFYRAGNTTGPSAYTGTSAPQSGHPIAAPPQGTWAATTHQLGPNVQILYQDITLNGLYELNFMLYSMNWAGSYYSPASLSYTGGNNQQFRVDIMNPAAPLLSVNPADVYLNIFQTNPGDPMLFPWAPYSADLSPWAGQTVRLRFAEVDNLLWYNGAVDDIRLVLLNQPPVAICQGAVVAVGEVPNIDGGSYDPDEGDTITLSQSPSGAFDEAGIYEVTLTVTDSHGATDSCTAMVVVYDPSAGFVTGGGWIYSDPNAYFPDPTLEGKANFGFFSKYKKGAQTPTGNTEFQFHAGDLNFHSSSYEWLVVTGSNYAKFKGSGTINGMGDYKFMLWAGDAAPDTFRIKIWTEVDEFEIVEYDNGFNQAIGGGSIIVHTGKK